jgi:hypothetical protein
MLEKKPKPFEIDNLTINPHGRSLRGVVRFAEPGEPGFDPAIDPFAALLLEADRQLRIAGQKEKAKESEEPHA